MAHTPTPWRYIPSISCTNEVYYWIQGKSADIGCVDNEEDAKLICGAPDLLEALEAISNHNCTCATSDVAKNVLGRLELAIAKAKSK